MNDVRDNSWTPSPGESLDCPIPHDTSVKLMGNSVCADGHGGYSIGGCCVQQKSTRTTFEWIKDVGLIGGLNSQLKPNYWEYELNCESDENLANYLREGVNEGFTIVDKNANVASYNCNNYKSELQGDSATCINSLIVTELLQEKFILADYIPACVHALGAARKKSGSYHPIMDCKRPLLHSINNYMEATFLPFKYHSSDSVCELMSRGCFMATVDISSAYRTVAINPDNWKYQGISWNIGGVNRYLYDMRLCFGLRCTRIYLQKLLSLFQIV